MTEGKVWARCAICGKPIHHGGVYYLCSVTTCNTSRRTFRFCTSNCWDAHVADRNHRNPECIEERAPAD